MANVLNETSTVKGFTCYQKYRERKIKAVMQLKGFHYIITNQTQPAKPTSERERERERVEKKDNFRKPLQTSPPTL